MLRCLKEVSKDLLNSFLRVSRIVHEIFKDLSTGSFKNFFKAFQGRLKLLLGCFKVVV